MKRTWRELTVATLLLAGVTGCSQHHHFPEPETIISVADDPKGLEKWILQDTHLSSKESLILALVSERKEVDKSVAYISQSVYIDSSKEAKNILFINSQNNSSSWLFKGNNQLIVEFSSVSNRQGYMPFPMMQEEEGRALYYKVVNRDTNGDGKVTSKDSPNLAVSDMLGKNYKVLVENVSHIISVKEMEKSLMFVYQKAGVGYSMQVSLNGFKVLSNNMLPKVGQ